jgi:HTH-type transcriptional regulator/antitoxin HigA
MDEDDFPLSPNCSADPLAYYDAFLRAERFLASVPAKSRGAYPDRALHELTSHLYESPVRLDTMFRASLGQSEVLSAVWLSKLRGVAEWFIAAEEVPPFQALSQEFVRDLVKLSSVDGGIAKVADELLTQGVIVLYEPAIPGMKVDGAVFRLATTGHPVIGLSLRYPRVDHYWFTLLHELAHVILHASLLSSPILDDFDAEESTLIERQADRLASDLAIPRNEWRSCAAKYSLNSADIFSFAKKLRIAPELVAGRLRREFKRYELFADIVNRIDLREILFGKSS